MNKPLLIVLAIAVLAVGAGVWLFGGASTPRGIDLVELFDSAQKQSNLGLHRAFSVGEFTIGGQKRRGIFCHPTSQITWHVTVPERAHFEVAIGMGEESYSTPGDGARFRVGVLEGGKYTPLFERHLNPAVWAADRGWQPIDLDLSAYAGRQVDLILNTHASADGEADPRNDFAVWGSPTIVQVRQP